MLGKPDDVPQNAETAPQRVIRGGYRVSSLWSRKQVTFETCSLGGGDVWSPCLAESLRKANWRLRPNSPERAQSPGPGASISSSLPLSPRTVGRPGTTGLAPAAAVGGGVLPKPPASRGRSSASRKHPAAARGRRKARGGSGI